jgi:hypothetical protein
MKIETQELWLMSCLSCTHTWYVEVADGDAEPRIDKKLSLLTRAWRAVTWWKARPIECDGAGCPVCSSAQTYKKGKHQRIQSKSSATGIQE